MTVSVTQPQQPQTVDDSVHCSSNTTTALLDAGHSRSMALSTGTATIINNNNHHNMSSSSSPSASTPSPGPRATNGHQPGQQASPSHQQATATTATTTGTPTSALRRLYFKTARASKAAAVASKVAVAASNVTTVPKVIVMGSSTASEATINTSTDSTATHITNVTTTTDTEPNDSLDLGDISGQSEPLLSSLDDESSSIVQLHHQTPGSGGHDEEDESLTISNGAPPDTPLLISYQELEDMSPRSPMFSPRQSPKVATNDSATARPQAHPRTAPSSSSGPSPTTRFPFDPPVSPIATTGTSNSSYNNNNNSRAANFARTHETMFSFDESPNPVRRPPPKLPPPSSIEHTPEHSPNAPITEFRLPPSSRAYNEPGLEMKGLRMAQPPVSAPGPVAAPPPLEPPPAPVQSTPKRLMNSFKTRKERFVQQAGSAVAAATAAVTTSGTGKPFKNPNYDPDLTMFPFDREAIDYDRIQRECFAVEEELLFDHEPRTRRCDGTEEDEEEEEEELDLLAATAHRLPIQGGGDSPSRLLFEAEIFSDHYSIFQQYAYLSQQERSGEATDGTPSKRNRKTSRGQPAVVDAFSPKRRTEPNHGPSPSSSSSKVASKFDQIATKFDMMPSKGTGGSVLGCGTLPDLRVDYFAETSCCSSSSITISPGAEPTGLNGEPAAAASSSPSAAAALVTTARAPSPSSKVVAPSGGGCRGTIDATVAVGAINVTPNPMEGAVCTQPPRATIVVQQPSLSLDYTSVETILLKNEGDFISVEQGPKDPQQQQQMAQKKKQQQQQQREEHMRQLLDVTNTLTTEEIKDFEMRYGSPHHSRSQSVKTPGSRACGRPNQLCLPQQRSRVASMPNTGVEEEYYRLRHFSITGKGVVNRGDSLKSRRSKSNNSVASSNSSTEHLTPAAGTVAAGSARTSATCSLASSRESSTSNPASGPYKVLMLGGAAVGKSSLVSQFMTSEYLHAYDTSIDDDSGEKTVSVLLSGEESELTFIDHSYTEMAPENCMATYDPHGYCVIYSSADKGSFLIAERILQILWTTENIAQKAVILVANKADLARSRMVASDEGKAMATQYDCKFIETSVGINHNVDELLVGLLSQIRLKLENPEKSRDLFRKRSIRKSKRRACSPLGGAICLAGMGGSTNPSTPVSGTPASGGGAGGVGGGAAGLVETPPGSAHSSPRKYRGSRTSASLKVKGLLGRVWARDSKSKSCENLHVL
ncbi:mucin-5AC-like isoform X2 [Anopheles albimanus]|nr:mucin-5AC-like isoform X2 [Anopheles albimanus]XP_035792928.1 mucin-5AC-like isoform X2 [Anopheles albimanus]XP_035792929.1 mucin-5AC-like isoform X2 [Anopheles albimanus]XP_035792930.1 mucin-5AC-like isoform X2 [Anopheles albimanus]XP_035792931.1 mucin-5AC-like isoform X2 [Anopheles albimanus]XP_035792932.1 mucin-5AC-like isoform X2 [Anopheles albimanus]XP_035792934.1 mucin-5AC-like isoform X2 [Anopheles albimanus]